MQDTTTRLIPVALEILWLRYIYVYVSKSSTYDHRRMRTGHPVRSGVLKHSTGCVVVGWVTTSEFQLLYVHPFCPLCTL